MRRTNRALITLRILNRVGFGVVFVLIVFSLSLYTYTRVGGHEHVHAQPSETINFQARLLRANGSIVPDGTYSVEFRLYDEAVGGSSQWTETQSVDVRAGYLSSYLGINSSFPSTIDWSQQQWLTMNVDADGEMSPRIRVTAVPFALQAGFADEAGGLVSGIDLLTADDFLQTAPVSVQSINASVAGLRFNQTGSGSLMQLQSDGINRFTVSRAGDVSATSFSGGGSGLTLLNASNISSGELSDTRLSNNVALLDGAQTFTTRITFGSGVTLGGSSATVAGSLRWTGSDFEGYNGSDWVSLTSGGSGGVTGDFFEQGGNAFGENAVVGTNDAFDFIVQTAGTERLRVDADGNVGIGRAEPLERLDIDGGLRLGNTTGTNAGTLRWNGVDFEGYDGTEWVSLTAGEGAGLGMLALGMFHAYNSTGGVGIGATFSDLGFNQQVRADDQFTHLAGAAPITIENDGWYEITYNISVSAPDGGNSQATAQARLVVDTGAGFNEIEGSTGSMFMRTTDNSSSASVTVLREFTAGDIVKLQAQRSAGDAMTINTVPGSVGITIRNIAEQSEGGGGSGGTGLEFTQNGNSFGARAILGTTDNQGLDIITNNEVALSISSGGLATFTGALTVESGGISVTGDSTINGALSVLNGLTIAAGGLDLSASGITNAGNITGVGDNITANNGLVISSGNNSNLTLNADSGTLILDANTWRRTAAGTTAIELNDVSDTTLQITNTGAGTANLNVDGAVTATGFTGDGSGLTTLNASNITSGTLNDARLSSNVALLNQAQTFDGLTTFSSGLVVGNTSTTTTGTIRWNGADFQGYDGTEWVSLTTGEGSGSSGGGGTGLEFVQNGNAFGAKAILGTTDAYGLDIITSGSVALAIDALGDATFSGSLTINNDVSVDGQLSALGGLLTIGDSTQAGSLELYSSSGNRATISTSSLAANRTFTLPDVSGEICTTAGNCDAGGDDALLLGGNTSTEALIVGAINNQDFVIKTNNTNRLRITGNDGTVNLLTGGLQTLGTTRLTSAGALQNITGLNVISGGANIAGGITITGGASISGGLNNNSGGITNTGAISGATTVTASGNINSSGGGLQTSGVTRLTNAGALQNISTMTASGNINTSTGAIQTNGVTRIANNGNLTNIGSITASAGISSATGFIANGLSGISGSCSGNNDYLVNFTLTGGIVTSGSCRQSGGLSDVQLKENVTSLDSSILDGMRSVNTVNFDFKCEDEAYGDLNLDCDRQTGVIAQELAEIFPELVYEGDDGYLRVRYDALNIYTLRAVSEVAKRVDGEGNISAKSLKTDNTVRMTSDGQLTNINGLSLVAGGASITGGIDNNLGGISNVGAINGVTDITAQTIELTAGQKPDALVINKDDKDVLTIADNGALRIMASSASALRVQSSQGDDIFNVDSEAGLVYIGSPSNQAKTVLLVLSGRDEATDPPGVNGAQYYNNAMNRFRCYQDDRWQDCISSAATEYILLASPTTSSISNDMTKIEGSSEVWVDISPASQMQLQLESQTFNDLEPLTCSIQYRGVDSSAAWKTTEATTAVTGEKTLYVSGWVDLPSDMPDEIIVRLGCNSNGDNDQSGITFGGARMQIR